MLNRTQTAVVNSKSSDKTPILSGVPQGTVLGPLLFLVYINDLPLSVNSEILLFADDALLYRKIESVNDVYQLQHDRNKLVEWESHWSIEFNPDKCKVLRVTNKRKIILSNYSMYDQILELVNSAKYLGVFIHKKLSWNTHVNYT